MFPPISGRVVLAGRVDPINLLEPRFELPVAGPGRDYRQIEVVIDTGFNGWLTLPKELLDELNLTRYARRPGRLADGTQTLPEIYSALALWHGQPRPILVHQVESEPPLVGTALLENCRLTVDMRQDGLVTIQPIP